MSAETADNAGTPQLKQFLMVNIKMGGLKGERVRPQSIRPLIKFPRGISDQVISLRAHDGGRERAPGPGQQPQASSVKLKEPQASSGKHQAPSSKRQA